MADYWPKEEGADLWCSVETITSQSGLSRATAYRALSTLQAAGWLVMTQSARHNRSPRFAPSEAGKSHGETDWSQDEPDPSHGDTRLSTETAPHSSTGSDEPNSGLSADATAPSSTGQKRPKRITRSEQERMNADYIDLRSLCRSLGEGDPYSIWWTLRLEHKATSPSCFMADLVDKGQWDGFVGRHGITEYERPSA